ncbi:hypothetical protein JD844_003649 [Phrynosoma platyrhinos]|uniref:phosphoinositide phospholipase C n=1 Tax=Phrynosoma platyrhinos TaxID=52577 RepID=A0ABQ7TDX4_PHRPL|nr:hypothetical protein JD844_003649 [Phrynosoma platyrhinos]
MEKYAKDVPEYRCFSIIFKDQRKNLDLIASSEEIANHWNFIDVRSLDRILGKGNLFYDVKLLNKQLNSWIHACLRKADKNKDNKMSFKELKNFLKEINILVDEGYARQIFEPLLRLRPIKKEGIYLFSLHSQQCDKSQTDTLEDDEIEIFYKILTERKEIDRIFSDQSEDKETMSLDNLVRFLRDVQHEEEAGPELALSLIEKYEPNETVRRQRAMTKDGFQMYLLSADGNIFNQMHSHVYQDMTQPLSHYYISSSHNTYLMEDQLKGPSSTEAYIRLLLILSSYPWRTTQLKGKILVKGKKLSLETEEVSDEDEAAEIEDEIGERLPSFFVLIPGTSFVRHNVRHLSRIYPAGWRTDSSNYNPVDMWNVGCQIVALNFQSKGVEMDVHQGRFQDNGLCGYVLKPEFLRDEQSEFNPKFLTEGSWWTQKKLQVKIISGQQLPKVNKSKNSIVDPRVIVEIHGVQRDNDKKQTRVIDNNGFKPTWDETFEFKIHVPKLALVRFMVEDFDASTKNDFIGQFTAPFASLKRGYRHIHLLTKNGDQYPSATLFVHINILDSD